MKHSYRSRFCMAAVLLLSALASHAGPGRVPEPAWVSLKYQASSLVGSVATMLELSGAARQDMQAPLYAALENREFQSTSGRLSLLSINTHIVSLLQKSVADAKIWFNPGNLAVLQRDRLRHGKNGSQKTYRFAGDGAFRLRREPADSTEAGKSPENWTRIKESFYPYDLNATGCKVVSEPVLLFYLVSSLETGADKGSREACVFFDDALYRVWLEPRGGASLNVNYVVNSGGESRKVSGRKWTLKVALRVEPITRGADRADFELLELRGDIAFFIDTVRKLPVRITGQRAGFGQLKIELVEALLRD